MSVWARDKFVILTNPRTGSTAIRDTLNGKPDCKICGRQHTSLHQIKGLVGTEKVAITVRNPFDAVHSWWMNVNQDEWDSFLEFIKNFNNRQFAPTGRLFWLTPREGSFVIRFESIQRDFDRFMQMVGMPNYELLRVNVTPDKGDYREAYGPEEVEAVRTRFYDDFKEFNYPMEIEREPRHMPEVRTHGGGVAGEEDQSGGETSGSGEEDSPSL